MAWKDAGHSGQREPHEQHVEVNMSLASGAEALSLSTQHPLGLSGWVPSVEESLEAPWRQGPLTPSAADSIGGSVSQSPEFAVVR